MGLPPGELRRYIGAKGKQVNIPAPPATVTGATLTLYTRDAQPPLEGNSLFSTSRVRQVQVPPPSPARPVTGVSPWGEQADFWPVWVRWPGPRKARTRRETALVLQVTVPTSASGLLGEQPLDSRIM